MKIGVMQPYFMPYIGYWQLLAEVDRFVVFDDVNYIKKGWINRNRILLNGQEHTFVLPLVKASQNKKINELMIFDGKNNKKLLYEKMTFAYKKSCNYEEVAELLKDIIEYEDDKLVNYITHSINRMCEYLGIKTDILISSDLEKNTELKGQDKILEICKILDADYYINPIGGRELYNKNIFAENGVKLEFIQTECQEYAQNSKEFVAGLSIFDVICNNSRDIAKELLKQYRCVENI